MYENYNRPIKIFFSSICVPIDSPFTDQTVYIIYNKKNSIRYTRTKDRSNHVQLNRHVGYDRSRKRFRVNTIIRTVTRKR